MSKFTNAEKQAEAEREVKMRNQVYGRDGHMTIVQKERIAIMEEIAAEYRALADRDRLL